MFSKPETDNSRVIVIVEGNIASGKSTLIKNLRKAGYTAWLESVDDMNEMYVDDNDETLMQKFYHDQETHAFALQIASFTSRWNALNEAISHLEESTNDQEIVFMERSIWSDSEIFAPVLHEDNKISDLHYNIYRNHARSRRTDISNRLKKFKIVFVHLNTTPEECCHRASIRKRDGEEGIPYDYFYDLDQKHQQWFTNIEYSDTDSIIVDVDSKNSPSSVAAYTIVEVEKLLNNI
jgi:deoxyadenosine/deoxycytidine kinase